MIKATNLAVTEARCRSCHAAVVDAIDHGPPDGQALSCTRCHEGGHWGATRFHHDETSYPLIGHHETAPCEGCHAGRKFKPTPRGCFACHGASDAHKGTLDKYIGDAIMAFWNAPLEDPEHARHGCQAALDMREYLVTWNFKHIANPAIRALIESLCRRAGYVPPLICTPDELSEV